MVLDTEQRRLEWRRVEYEIGMIQKLMRQIGLPPRLSREVGLRAVNETGDQSEDPSSTEQASTELHGRRPGDRRVRVKRPYAEFFRYSGPGMLVARPAASRPRTASDRLLTRLRGLLIGRPLSIHEEITERLSKKKALAIFSSDPISSSAYASEEMLRVLALAGAGALLLSLPIAIAISLLLLVVSLSYRQIVGAYPQGGGDYAVARRNLPALASLIVAGALLLDYVMTVAVSTASAADQLVSAFPVLGDVKIWLGVGSIALITLGNLRGIRESGNIFAVPTYLFVGSALLMIAMGLFRVLVNGEGALPPNRCPARQIH
jgi:hypothetical protein